MHHGHIEYIPLRANPKRAEVFAKQHIRYCRRQLRYCRRLRLKKQLDRLYPLLWLLGTVAVFGMFIVFSALKKNGPGSRGCQIRRAIK